MVWGKVRSRPRVAESWVRCSWDAMKKMMVIDNLTRFKVCSEFSGSTVFKAEDCICKHGRNIGFRC